MICSTTCAVFSKVKDEDGRQGKGEDQKGKGKSHVRKRESSYVDEYGNEEVHVGGKRFKLYEKKTLNYKKAKAYCKKHDGKLAEGKKKQWSFSTVKLSPYKLMTISCQL